MAIADLVPSSGAWWGTSPGSGGSGGATPAGLALWESFASREADIVHVYKSSASWTGVPTADENTMFAGAIPFYNWKPQGLGTFTWQQIADGDNDAAITTVAHNLAALGVDLFLAIAHEPDNDTSGDPAAAAYRAMFRHVVTLMRVEGATNVAYVWNPSGYSSQGENSSGKGFNRFWPGDDVVDWVAWNPYQLAVIDDLDEMMAENVGGVSGWTGFHAWATTAATADSNPAALDLWYDFAGTKPLMLAEWGNWFDLNSDTEAAAFITSIGSQAASYPEVKAFVQFNVDIAHLNHIDGHPLSEAAYATVGNLPYFIHTTPSPFSVSQLDIRLDTSPGATSEVSNSVAYTAGNAYLVAVTQVILSGVTPDAPTLSGWSTTWTQVSDRHWSTGAGTNRRTTCFTGTPSGSGTGALTYSYSTQPSDACITILEITGGSTTVVQSVDVTAGNAFTSATLDEPITMATPGSTNNRFVAFVATNVDNADLRLEMDADTGGEADWTSFTSAGSSSSPVSRHAAGWLDADPNGDLTPGHISSTSAGDAYIVCFEIQAAPAAIVPADTSNANTADATSVTATDPIPVPVPPTPVEVIESSWVQIDVGLDLLDSSGAFALDISDDLQVEGSSVARVMGSRIHGTCDLVIGRRLQWGSCRVRPKMTITNADGDSLTWNLGVYALTTPSRVAGESPESYRVSGFDLLSFLASPHGATYSASAGAVPLTLVASILTGLGIPNAIDQTAIGSTLAEPMVRPLDQRTTTLSIVNDLLASIGYGTLWIDRDGRARSAPLSAGSSPMWAYNADSETTTVGESRTETADLWQVPNRWVFVRNGGTTAPVEGAGVYTVENVSDGESSQAGRGRVINRVDFLDAVDQAALVAQGDAIVAADRRVVSTLSMQVAPNPEHWHADRVTYADTTLGVSASFEVVEWRLPLDGGDMSLEMEAL